MSHVTGFAHGPISKKKKQVNIQCRATNICTIKQEFRNVKWGNGGMDYAGTLKQVITQKILLKARITAFLLCSHHHVTLKVQKNYDLG
jgi:L-ribulose-5-phosphate 3-epimerase UlaE